MATNAVVLSRPAGVWGAEMGANDHAVTIGCSHVQSSGRITSGLTAHDLVRLVYQQHLVTGHLPCVRSASLTEGLDVSRHL